MSFEKFASGVSGFVNRTLQKTEEALKIADKTPIDSDVEKLTRDCELRHNWAVSLLHLTEALIEPNPANRAQDAVLQAFDRKTPRVTELEHIGELLVKMGEHFSENETAGAALVNYGHCESSLGKALRDFEYSVESTYLAWLRGYLQKTSKPALAMREELENLRLDLDRAKNQLKHATSDESKRQKYQQSVDDAQVSFDRQTESTKQRLTEAVAQFDNHKDSLGQLMNAQREYHENCLRTLNEALN